MISTLSFTKHPIMNPSPHRGFTVPKPMDFTINRHKSLCRLHDSSEYVSKKRAKLIRGPKEIVHHPAEVGDGIETYN